MEYTIDYFIKKFEAIPKEKWCVDNFFEHKTIFIPKKKKFLFFSYNSYEKKEETNFCAQGHCMGNEVINWFAIAKKKGIPQEKVIKSYPELQALILLFGYESEEIKTIAQINNGDDIRYQQPTAKQRVLKALYDLKEKQEIFDIVEDPVEEIKNILITSK